MGMDRSGRPDCEASKTDGIDPPGGRFQAVPVSAGWTEYTDTHCTSGEAIFFSLQAEGSSTRPAMVGMHGLASAYGKRSDA